ncbi:MAG: aldo/keto reductase [Pirellulales bacterium]|nr:aldo/keto reductase [Pirellulales bacterium]
MTEQDKQAFSRRAFVCQTGRTAAAAVLGAQAISAAAAEPAKPIADGVPRRVLGRTGVSITTFTLGTAPCGSLPPDKIAELVNAALDEGVTAVDTSEKYQNSQEGVGLALGKRRKDVFLSTKVFANSIPEAEESLAKSIRLLKTDYFDLLYYHGLGNLNIEGAMDPEGVFTWLVKQKKTGKCRFVGISGHNLPARFPQFLESGEVDVLLAAVNFADCHTYNFEENVLPIAQKHNVGIVAMKVYGGVAGMNYKITKGPQIGEEHVPAALRYALGLPGVASANLGVHTAEQIRHNVEMVKNFKPLSEDEHRRLLDVGKQLAASWGEHFGPVVEKRKA